MSDESGEARCAFRAEGVYVPAKRRGRKGECHMSGNKAIENSPHSVDVDWSSEVSFCNDKIVAVSDVVKTLVDNLQLGSVRKILLERYSHMKKWYGTASANDSEWEQTGCIIADTRRHRDVLLGIPRSLFAADNEMWCGGNGILGREDVGLDLPTWMELNGSKRSERNAANLR